MNTRLHNSKHSPAHGATRVLFLCSTFKSRGGAEKNVLELIEGLTDRGFVCYLAALDGGPALDLAKERAHVWNIGLKKILSVKGWKAGLELRRFLREQEIDVVFTYHQDADIWGSVFSWLAGVPVISSRRDMGYLLESRHVWSYRLLNQFFPDIVAVSDAVAEIVAKREWTSRSKITTIYNGVRVPHLAPINVPEARMRLGLHPNKITFGMVASFRPVKGQEFFVEAAAEVHRKFEDTQFVVAGSTEGSYFESVNELIHRKELDQVFHCLGERSDITDVLRLFDVFVISSRQEGFSNAIIEAMALGIPVVATRSGGNVEAVKEGVTGFLTRPNDSHDLAEALMLLVRQPSLRASMSKACREEVQRRFSYERMIAQVANIVQASTVRATGRAAVSTS